jgi:hypothetical protein
MLGNMFWSSKHKCPVDTEDKEWIEKSLLWFASNLETDFLLTVPIVTPTSKYFDRKLTRSEDTAHYCLRKVAEWMSVNFDDINLSFYSEETIEFSEGLVTEHDPETKTSAGKYQETSDGKYEIMIEVQQLQDPLSLLATFAHELAHVKLLGEWKLDDNDEYLTDLATVVWGLGIFNANSVIKSNAWQGSTHQGWSVGNQGYMSQQMFAYSLALLANYRGETEPKWSQYLCKDVLAYFERSIAYIEANPDEIEFKKESTSANTNYKNRA